MNRITRNALAGALAAAVALGAAAPAAVAAPRASHSKVDHRSAHVKAQKLTKAERRLAAQKRQLAAQVRNKSRQLARVQRWNRVESLDDLVETDLRENVQGDIEQLGGVATVSSTADLKSLRAEVRGIRPDVYNRIVSQLHRAERLKAELTATGADATLVATVDGVIETLRGYDAETARDDLRATQKALSSVADTLEGDETDEQEAPETEVPNSGSETGGDTATVS